MSRVIKFRFFSKETDRYVDANDYCVTGSGEVYCISDLRGYQNTHELSHAINKEQFSGFVDNNAIDAYEGDIIKITRNNPSWINELVDFAVVKFTGCSFIVEFDGKKLNLSNSYWGTEMQVIGNVHQNPELLK